MQLMVLPALCHLAGAAAFRQDNHDSSLGTACLLVCGSAGTQCHIWMDPGLLTSSMEDWGKVGLHSKLMVCFVMCFLKPFGKG
jgi:hypothetical protein